MKILKFLLSMLFAFAFNATMASVLSPIAGLTFTSVFVGLNVLSLIPMPHGVALMAVQKEIWVNDIVEALYKANPFLNFAQNGDGYVLNGKVVHIPQAGASPSVSKNRSSLPATVNKRTDTDVTFALDEYTSDPVLIPNADNYELSYDKRNSVLANSKSAISELMAEWILRSWSPATNIVRTTGAAVAAHTPSATGNRKAITWPDISALQKTMNKDSVDKADRFIMLDSDMYQMLVDALSESQYRDFSAGLDIANGILGKRYGFSFMERSTVAVYGNETTPVCKDPGAAGASADNAAAIAWQKMSVIKAVGTVDFFEDLKNPQYYGDVYSTLVRAGGRIYRNDGKGVYAIVEAAST